MTQGRDAKLTPELREPVRARFITKFGRETGPGDPCSSTRTGRRFTLPVHICQYLLVVPPRAGTPQESDGPVWGRRILGPARLPVPPRSRVGALQLTEGVPALEDSNCP